MKTPTLLKFSVLFWMIIFLPMISIAQVKLDDKVIQIRALVDKDFAKILLEKKENEKKGKKTTPEKEPQEYNFMVAGYLLDTIIKENQKALSGSQIEAGKSFATSLSITDEGATANISLGKVKSIYPQLTFSGKGKDKFINIFKDGKYSQAITGGFNLNIFWKSSGFFSERNKAMLIPEIKPYVSKVFKDSKTDCIDQSAYDTEVKAVQKKLSILITNLDCYKKSWQQDQFDDTVFKGTKEFEENAKELIDLGILDEDFLKVDKKDIKAKNHLSKIEKIICSLNENWNTGKHKAANDYRKWLMVKDVDVIQLKANWNGISYHWFTISGNYNINPYSVLDTSTGAVDRDFKKTENDNYFSGRVAYNYLKVNSGNQNRWFLSGTINVSNARQYDPDGMITLESTSPYPIGQVNLSQKTLSTQVYENIAPRKFAANIQLTASRYWSKANLGLEVSPKFGFNDINNDNIGMKIGVFIPVEVKDGVPVTIEPVFKFQKLFESSKYKFWKDNVVVGFNLSVSIPTIPNKKEK